ncbi:hypothetical protein B0G84_2375 [Paraburkholderia sp. BL8N3]|nr:hypothetical protein [Paraburkholderia sp. BL8N3]TCK44027.1 hypothetical protein B0G84_2375 [Paraburkholderia sp. BL8N3]
MDFEHTRSSGRRLTYQITINVKPEGVGIFFYDAIISRDGHPRGLSFSGKALRATDANKAAAEARQQVTQYIEAFSPDDE